jgi:type IV secretory pathway VirB10-like protein
MTDDLPPEQDPAADPAADERAEEKVGRRTAILIVAAAVVVLAAIGVGIYLVATAGDSDVADPAAPTITDPSQPEPPPSTPPPSEPPVTTKPPATKTPPPPAADQNVAAARTAAEDAAAAINKRDVSAMRQLSCDPSTVGSVDAFPPQATARLVENPEVTGNKATAQIELSISGSEPTVVPLPMEKRGGKWCVP